MEALLNDILSTAKEEYLCGTLPDLDVDTFEYEVNKSECTDQHDRLAIPIMFSRILRVYIIDGKVFVYAQLPNTVNEFFIYGENKKVCKVAENVTLREGLNEDLIYIDEEIRKK